MANKNEKDDLSNDDMKPVGKPKPSAMEQVAMVMVTIGIGTTVVPFVVKFLGGLDSMSDGMVMIAIGGVIVLVIGGILAIVARSKTAKQSDPN